MKKILLSLTCLIGFSINAYATESATKVSFHDSKASREWKIINELYHPFLTAHSDVKVESSVIDLDGKGVGSIFIKFVSPGTCRINGCLTNVVRWNTTKKNWEEVWSYRTDTMWVGGPSPTSFGQNMKEIYSDDGLMWRWIGKSPYYPEIRSLGKTLWPQTVQASPSRQKFAFDNVFSKLHNDKADITKIAEIPVNLTGIGTQYVLVDESIAVCGDVGCPFIVVDGNDHSGYRIKASGTFNSLGITMPNTTNGPEYAPFAVQVGNGIEYYAYNKNQYKAVKNTWRP